MGGVSGADCTLYETDSWSGQDGRVSGRGQGLLVPCMRQTADQERMGVSVGGVSGAGYSLYARQTADQERMGVSVGGAKGRLCPV